MPLTLIAAALLLTPASAVAQQAEFKPPPEMLAAMKKAASPGPEHQALADLVGDWAVVTTVWPGPGAPALTFEGTVQKSWALGGRFLHEKLTSAGPGGQTLLGLGYVGFDRALGKYQGIYMATDRTGMVTYSGTQRPGKAGGATRTFTYDGVQADPLGKGAAMKFKMSVQVDGPDRHTLTQFYVVPGVGEVRAFQMVHTRTSGSTKKP